MKTTACFLLIFVFFLQLMVSVHTEARKSRNIFSYQGDFTDPQSNAMSCTSVKATGKLSSCPSGMTATGCACGHHCGSWNVQNENMCQCLCPLVPWTMARCCKLS